MDTQVKLDFKKMNGLLPFVAQDAKSKEVLMVGFMNELSWEKTLELGKVTYWSRTRNRIATKGETSGNFLIVQKVFLDCDNDTLLIKVKPLGPTCHLGNRSCFAQELL